MKRSILAVSAALVGLVVVGSCGRQQQNQDYFMNIDRSAFTIVAGLDDLYSLTSEPLAMDLSVAADGTVRCWLNEMILDSSLTPVASFPSPEVERTLPRVRPVFRPDGSHWLLRRAEAELVLEKEDVAVVWPNAALGTDEAPVGFHLVAETSALAVFSDRVLRLDQGPDGGRAQVLDESAAADNMAVAFSPTQIAVGRSDGVLLLAHDGNQRRILDLPAVGEAAYDSVSGLAFVAESSLLVALSHPVPDHCRVHFLDLARTPPVWDQGVRLPSTWDMGEYVNPCVLKGDGKDGAFLLCAQFMEGSGSAVLLSFEPAVKPE